MVRSPPFIQTTGMVIENEFIIVVVRILGFDLISYGVWKEFFFHSMSLGLAEA